MRIIVYINNCLRQNYTRFSIYSVCFCTQTVSLQAAWWVVSGIWIAGIFSFLPAYHIRLKRERESVFQQRFRIYQKEFESKPPGCIYSFLEQCRRHAIVVIMSKKTWYVFHNAWFSTGTNWKVISGCKEGQTHVDSPSYDNRTWWCHPIDVHFASKGIQGTPTGIYV